MMMPVFSSSFAVTGSCIVLAETLIEEEDINIKWSDGVGLSVFRAVLNQVVIRSSVRRCNNGAIIPGLDDDL